MIYFINHKKLIKMIILLHFKKVYKHIVFFNKSTQLLPKIKIVEIYIIFLHFSSYILA